MRAAETTATPDARGRFGRFGGRYVPEVLIPALDELAAAWVELRDEPAFRGELDALLRDFVGRPSPLTFASRLSGRLGYRVYLKREDLNHTGAHKINNTLGQVLLARRLGKRRIIAETGAGMHGVATATACALFGLPCVVYMGEEDTVRQAPNVGRMQLLGSEVVTVTSGSRTLKDAMNEAMRDWAGSVRETHYVIGSVAGPHPFPALVRDLQRVIGDEAKAQFLDAEGSDPDAVVACVGGGSNAMGIFAPFVGTAGTRLVGVEAGGRGDADGEHCRSLTLGVPGVLHGSFSYLLQDGDGQVLATHSISAGLDYPGVGPEHSYMKETGLASYVSATDSEALEGFQVLGRLEGILPALEPAHAVGWLLRRPLPDGSTVLVNLSGRGDKDLDTVRRALGEPPADRHPRA
ncbi:MAG TPA: tryptophan synthase subunit beta [Actinomycetota bacterium]|nr:tryptophan synthase subunit beta [Actinomycetota bacterium]